jgi:hypothetical protein
MEQIIEINEDGKVNIKYSNKELKYRELIIDYFQNHCENASVEGISNLCECSLCKRTTKILE